MQATEREVLYSGAFGAGKSRIGDEKGYYLSVKYPQNRGLICRKKYTDLRDTTLDTWRRYVCPEEAVESYNKQEHLMVLKNGSEVLFYGLDQWSKVGSLEVGWIFVDEVIEFTEEDWLMLLGRLRHPLTPFHQIFAATNPGDPTHWVYKRFYENQELKRKGITKVLESNSLQNPFTPQAYRDHLDASMTGRYRERFVEGKWISFEGIVYDVWDPSHHILQRDTTNYNLTGDPNSPIPDDWERFRVIDFGFTNPFVCLWAASATHRYEGPAGRQDRIPIPFNERVFIIYKEIYYSGRTASEHVKQITGHSTGETYRANFADWDAGDRADLEQGGVPTFRAQKEVSAGIQATYEAIAADRIFYLEGSLIEQDSQLGLASKPQSLVEEFGGYIRPKGKDGKFNPKEDPAKVNDHGLDALRYLIYSLKIAYGIVEGMESKTVFEVEKARHPETQQRTGYGALIRQSRSYTSSTAPKRPSWRGFS
jgi:phage terminase large subunit|tara:strand:+ start:1487 stop:2926 length:1440 start_codon:yes stop_codon:yes gene_type:complete